MNLVIDIGNTRAKLFVYDGENLTEQVYDDSETLSTLDKLTQQYAFSKGIVSSVGRIGTEAEARIKCLPFEVVRLDESTKLPVALNYKPWGSTECIPMPPTMGADRIAALVGGMTLYPNKPLLIIDAGTCVTYEIIDECGDYRGGNIAPGLTMRLKAMHEHTALLPLVSTDGEIPKLGYDTDTAMRSGATLGLTYEIEGYIEFWRQQYPTLHVLLTGGNDLAFNDKNKTLIERNSGLVAIGLNAILNSQQ